MKNKLPSSTKVVVIGGGVVGCSVAYHLAKLGWKDTILLERDQLTSGTTWHAAGLVSQLGPSAAITKIRKYTLDLYKELEKEVDHSAGLRLNGALSIAQNKGRWQELQRQATTAQLYDVDVRILDKDQIKKEIEEKEHLLEEKREEYRRKFKVTKREAFETATEIMEEVGITESKKRFNQYPFQFSGGMRQRIVIAIALANDAEILICDEPTTALDVTIQAQILELINRIKDERNLTIIFITHDLGVIAETSDIVCVMYLGKIVEMATTKEIFSNPQHPYTQALMKSIPRISGCRPAIRSI